jgi:glycosyltransferase involved in cell wall biosynthesis
MKKVCMLLNGSIYHDSRVIKTIRTLSEKAQVDLFYINGDAKDNTLFNDNVTLFSFKHSNNKIITKLRKHSCFYNEFLFFEKAVLSQNTNYDLIYCNDLPCLKPGYLIKKETGAQLIYDSHEIYTGTINQFFPDNVNIIKKTIFNGIVGLMRFLGNRAEKKMVKHVDTFITTSHSFKTYFEEKFDRNDVQIVMNCPPMNTIKGAFDFRAHYNLSKQDFIVIFQGVFNKGRALLTLIEAFKYTKKNVHLIFVGSGSLLPEMERAVKMHNLTNNIHFFGRVSSTELLYYTKGADVGINLQASINISKKLASANKLFEYIHAGIPVIASNVPENALILNAYNIGYLVQNEKKEIAATINTISKLDLQAFKHNTVSAKQEYNWEKQEMVLKEIIV